MRCIQCLLILFAITACSTFDRATQDGPPPVTETVVSQADSQTQTQTEVESDLPPDAVPRHEPRSKYGNPPSYVVFGKTYRTLPSSQGFVQRGIASWYGKKFHGRRTSSGETYDMYGMTAAHTQLPLPTYVQVTNLKNGKQVVLKVNDRGPFHGNRVIDLSYSAARKLDIVREGTGLVEVRAIDPGRYQARQQVRQQVNEENKSASIEKDGIEPAVVDEQQAVYVEKNNDQVAASSNPKVFVQVGAFGQLENANQLLNQLSSLNLGDVSISSVVQDAKQLHRVRIGPLASVELADQTINQLNEMGMKDHRVVID